MKIKNTPDGLVCYIPEKYLTIRLTKKESLKMGVKCFPKDTPPEVVHLEIADRCNLQCPYCYVKDKATREISTEDWKSIIKQLADAGVFQVTFGGGEPTMREDLGELARYVKSLNLTLCMTSNGLLIPEVATNVLRMFDQINISWHRQPEFENALNFLKISGIKRGINFCLSKFYVKDVEIVKKFAKKYEAEMLFLTYKPVNNDGKNQISPSSVLYEAKKADKQGVAVAIDGMTCSQCLASKRFCDINSLGNLTTCSFIREPVGNLLKENFKDVWSRRNRNIKCPYLKGGESK